MEELRRVSIELYEHAAAHAEARGIILADTKFEFGASPGAEVVLGDEVFTPDSSRFWPADEYEPGRPQRSFDKQYLRDWLDQIGWDHTPPAPELPDEVVANTRAKYLEAYERITGETPDGSQPRPPNAGLATVAYAIPSLVAELVVSRSPATLSNASAILGRHLGPPPPHPAGARRARDQLVLALALLGRDRAAAHRMEVADHRLHPLLGAAVVVEHPAVPRQVDEARRSAAGAARARRPGPRTGPPCRCRGAAAAPGAAHCPAPRPTLPPPPGVARPPAHLAQRQGDVAAVADQMDEVRLGQGTLDPPRLPRVRRRLVAPAGLALLSGICLVERPGGVARASADRDPPSGARPRRGSRSMSPQRGWLTISSDRSLAKLGALDSLLDPAVEVREQPRKEVGLGGDRQLWMRVEHQPQERGARAGDADHEWRGHTTGVPPAVTEPDPRPANAPPANAVEQSHG